MKHHYKTFKKPVWKPQHLLEFIAPGLVQGLSTSHSLQFATKRHTFRFLTKVLDVGDYIFISPGFKPLWGVEVAEGVVTAKTQKTLSLLQRQVEVRRIHGAESLYGSVSTEVWVPTDHDLLTQRGFRVDKDWIFTKDLGVVQRCNLQIGPSSTTSRKAVYSPREIFTKDPVRDFLNHVLPGDYLTIWSEEDKGTRFMHYPVQGWVTGVDKKTWTVSYIHPPRMDIKTFRFGDYPNCQYTMGFYRKLVIQCANAEREEQKKMPKIISVDEDDDGNVEVEFEDD